VFETIDLQRAAITGKTTGPEFDKVFSILCKDMDLKKPKLYA